MNEFKTHLSDLAKLLTNIEIFVNEGDEIGSPPQLRKKREDGPDVPTLPDLVILAGAAMGDIANFIRDFTALKEAAEKALSQRQQSFDLLSYIYDKTQDKALKNAISYNLDRWGYKREKNVVPLSGSIASELGVGGEGAEKVGAHSHPEGDTAGGQAADAR